MFQHLGRALNALQDEKRRRVRLEAIFKITDALSCAHVTGVTSLEWDELNVESPASSAFVVLGQMCPATVSRCVDVTLVSSSLRIWTCFTLFVFWPLLLFAFVIMVPKTSWVASSDQPISEILRQTFWWLGSHEFKYVADQEQQQQMDAVF